MENIRISVINVLKNSNIQFLLYDTEVLTKQLAKLTLVCISNKIYLKYINIKRNK